MGLQTVELYWNKMKGGVSENLSERHGLRTPTIVSHHVILGNSHVEFLITATRESVRTHK